MTFKSCNNPIENIHKLFSIETLMHTNTSSKTTHNIKNITHKNNVIHAHAYCFMP
jgi:hypothetical protein